MFTKFSSFLAFMATANLGAANMLEPVATGQHRDLQFAIYDITSGAFTPNADSVAGQYRVVFTHSTGGNPNFELYSAAAPQVDPLDGCFSRGATLIGEVPAATNALVGIETQALAETAGGPTSTWDFKVTNAVQDNANVYSETGPTNGVTTAKVQFCIRFSLNELAGLASYDEMAINLEYTLDGGFDELKAADTVTAATLDATPTVLDNNNLESDTSTYGVYAQECSLKTAVAQGDVVSICVHSDSYPEASVASFVTLDFSSSDGASQAAVTAGAIQAPFSVDGLCQVNGADDQYCRIDSILEAATFYDTAAETITISGEVELVYGTGARRRLRVSNLPVLRKMEQDDDDSARDFEMQIDTAPVDVSDPNIVFEKVTGVTVTLEGVSSLTPEELKQWEEAAEKHIEEQNSDLKDFDTAIFVTHHENEDSDSVTIEYTQKVYYHIRSEGNEQPVPISTIVGDSFQGDNGVMFVSGLNTHGRINQNALSDVTELSIEIPEHLADTTSGASMTRFGSMAVGPLLLGAAAAAFL